MISIEQLEIIAREKCPKAAKILGIELQKVRYYKRRIREGHIDIKTPKKEKRKPHKWTPNEDSILIKEISNNSIQQAVNVLQIPKAEIEKRFNFLLKIEKIKLPVLSILIQFPNLLPGQIQQMKNIYEYSPQSALKYCQVIQSYNDKYISDEEQVNCF